MDTLQKLVSDLHEIVVEQLTFHDKESVQALVDSVKSKIEQIEAALVDGTEESDEDSDGKDSSTDTDKVGTEE